MSDITVYVYPNARTDDDLAETARSALETGLEEITASTAIDGYGVEIRREYPNERADSSYGFLQNFDDWRGRNGFTETGSHLGVSNAFGGGVANGGQFYNAFTTDTSCVAGSAGASDAFFRNAAIHEVCHTLIDPSLPAVSELIGENDEHTLGMVYEDRTVSPMLTGYARRGLGNTGQCSNDLYPTRETTTLTSCTLDALEYTREDRIGGDADGGDDPWSWWWQSGDGTGGDDGSRSWWWRTW